MLDCYLASASPRRRELLSQLGYRFEVLLPAIEECRGADESPQDYVQRLAREKACAGLQLAPHDHPVIGCDTIVVCQQQVLEKPKDLDDALRMWQLLSGRQHQVYTAVAVTAAGRGCEVELVGSEVWFRPLSEAEMHEYWHSGEPQDKAGAYGIQGLGGKFVSRIEGDFFAIVGLPLMTTDLLLKRWLHGA